MSYWIGLLVEVIVRLWIGWMILHFVFAYVATMTKPNKEVSELTSEDYTQITKLAFAGSVVANIVMFMSSGG